LGSGERFAGRDSDFVFVGNNLQDREIHPPKAEAREGRASGNERVNAGMRGKEISQTP